jgi:amino acid adenylation domain-containing protein
MNARYAALSPAQYDIYLSHLTGKPGPRYNIGGYISLSSIDVPRLIQAHERVTRERPVFHVSIVEDGTGARQLIGKKCAIDLNIINLSDSSTSEKDADAWIKHQFETPIELLGSRLFHAWLIILGPSTYRYVGLAHHIAMDGYGFSLWAKDMCDAYNGANLSFENESESPFHGEESQSSEAYANTSAYARDKDYWMDYLSSLPDSYFKIRPEMTALASTATPSTHVSFKLTPAQYKGLEAAASLSHVKVHQVVLAALVVYMARGYGVSDLIIGMPIHNRDSRASKDDMSSLASILPIRIKLESVDVDFLEVCREIARQTRAGLRHRRFPVSRIPIARGARPVLPSEMVFNYLPLASGLVFDGFPAKLIYQRNNHEQHPLMVTLRESDDDGSSIVEIECNSTYFSKEEAQLLSRRIELIIAQITMECSRPLSHFAIIPIEERRCLSDEPLVRDSQIDPTKSIHNLFLERAKSIPAHIAVEFAETRITYRELSEAALAIAHGLAKRGVKKGSRVGICMQRCWQMVPAMLGTLMAGAAYVPLIPSAPHARTKLLIEQSSPELLIAHAATFQKFESLNEKTVLVEELIACGEPLGEFDFPASDQSDLAYILFTSGTSGRPKGVEITHANVAALLNWARSFYSAEDLSRVVAGTSLSFDLSVFELYLPLIVGGCCVIVEDILDLIDRKIDATLINTVPSAAAVLLESDAIPSGVRIINLAGEPLGQDLVNALLRVPGRSVVNLYGPTEDTTYSTYAKFTSAITTPPHIGAPISGTSCLILSPLRELTPTGITGELFLTGAGVARGYIGDPLLTGSVFFERDYLPSPLRRFYKTGDQARKDVSGNLWYVGRADDQLKIRGYRVEPAEVNFELQKLDLVTESAMIAKQKPNGPKYLAAYVHSPALKSLNESERLAALETIKSSLHRALPGHMVPSAIHYIDSMPLLDNGKLDRSFLHQLRDIDVEPNVKSQSHTGVDEQLQSAWSRILGVERNVIGSGTSLFDNGGNSLTIVSLQGEIERIFNLRIHIREMLSVETIGVLGARIVASKELLSIYAQQQPSTTDIEGFI